MNDIHLPTRLGWLLILLPWVIALGLWWLFS
jgi:hypothetical protein